jgi:hypothetical protein
MERIDRAVQLLTEMPGYEDIFEHFRKEYAENVLNCLESDMVDARRRYDWLDEFKRDLDNMTVRTEP